MDMWPWLVTWQVYMAYLDAYQCTSHLQAEAEDSPTPVVLQTEDSTEIEPCLLLIIDTSRYSNIYRLLAVTAYVRPQPS